MSLLNKKESKGEVDDFDISILKTLPRQLIGEAVNYIKNKKHLEEMEAIRKRKEEEEQYSKIKCIPPWAKTLAGQRKPKEIKDVATQYEMYCEGREGEIEKGDLGKVSEHDLNISAFLVEGGLFEEDVMGEYSEGEEGRKEMGEEYLGDISGEDGDNIGKLGEDESLEKLYDTDEDHLLDKKIGSKEKGMDEEGNEIGDEELDKIREHPDNDLTREGRTRTDDEENEKGSVSSSKGQEAITDTEVIDDGYEKGNEDEELGVEHEGDSIEDQAKGDSIENQEGAKEMSDSDYERAHAEYLGDEFKAGGISSEFADGTETGGSTELLQGEDEMGTGDERIGEGTSEETAEEKLGNDSKYLQKHFGNYLVKALAEIAWRRPADPIHYLAHRLYHARHIEEMKVKNHCQEIEIQQARMLYAMEMKEQIDHDQEIEGLDEDEELLEEADILPEVQESEVAQESLSDISELLSKVEPEERISPDDLRI